MKLSKLYFILLLLTAFGCGTKHHTTGIPISIGTTKGIEAKYSQLLGVSQENISNKKLYAFIDDWHGIPYQYGGKTKKGVDCSGFTIILCEEVFGKELIGSSSSLYNQCSTILKEKLREGDLVFFRIDSKEISHVGVYLQNNKFVHATTKAGVMIDDLNEEYYKNYFAGGGKIK